MLIKKLSDIDYSKNDIITFDATVIKIINEGDGEKKPFRFTVKLEESGEMVDVSSWKFSTLPTIKALVTSDEVYKFEGSAGVFGNYGEQIRIGNVTTTGNHSNRKVVKNVVIEDIKKEINNLIKTYIHDKNILTIVNELLLNNENFWKWPAATKVHHAYVGGLAKHSLGVAKSALSIWQNYKGDFANIELVIAGSLLHDIGKIKEYNEDGSRTIYGNLIPHPVAGIDMISKVCEKHGIDQDKDMNILMLRHIVLTHHEKIEYGAATQPYIAEAWIVAQADAIDAKMESISTTNDTLDKFQASDRIMSLDGGKILRWK